MSDARRIVLITNCTARKRIRAHPNLQLCSVPRGSIPKMAHKWAQRIHSAPGLLPAHQMYTGRGIRESARAASLADGQLYVLSAGLGLVGANNKIPAYEATISGSSDNNPIRRSRNGGNSSFEWWQHVTRFLGTPSPLRKLVEDSTQDTIVILAISRPYLLMVSEELTALSRRDLQRVRILSHGPPRGLPKSLHSAVIKYGEQFDGPDSPLPGTKGDFLQRAAVHFIGSVVNSECAGTSYDHQLEVDEFLRRMAFPSMPKRRRMSDVDLVELIRANLPAVNYQSSRMLRHLRDNLKVSCEQARFRDLFKVAVSRSDNKDHPFE